MIDKEGRGMYLFRVGGVCWQIGGKFGLVRTVAENVFY